MFLTPRVVSTVLDKQMRVVLPHETKACGSSRNRRLRKEGVRLRVIAQRIEEAGRC